MSGPRILFVHRATGNFGDAIRVDRIFRFLRNSGFDVTRVCLPSLSPSYLRKEGTENVLANVVPLHRPTFREPPGPLLGYLNRNLVQNFFSRHPEWSICDVVLAETSIVGWYLLGLAEKTSKPLVVDIHGLAGAEAKGGRQPFWHLTAAAEAETFRKCDHLTVVSNRMEKYVANTFNIPRKKISIIHNGTDPPQAFAKFARPLRVIFAGQFSYWEKVGDYLDLAKRARKGAFKFYLAGSGPLSRTLQNRIRRERIAIEYLGYLARPKVQSLISDLQIGIAPSTDDLAREVAFPLKVLDYMACGLPVVCPKIGEWGDLIESEDCGIAVERNSVDEYIAAIDTLAKESEWILKSSNGIEAARTRFYWSKVLAPFKELITQLAR